jgi:hypothetical protein
MAIYSGFTHWKWWFSIAMLVYQRVLSCEITIFVGWIPTFRHEKNNRIPINWFFNMLNNAIGQTPCLSCSNLRIGGLLKMGSPCHNGFQYKSGIILDDLGLPMNYETSICLSNYHSSRNHGLSSIHIINKYHKISKTYLLSSCMSIYIYIYSMQST